MKDYNSWTSRNEESRTTRRTFSDSTYETGPHLPVSWGSSVGWCSNVEEMQMPRGEEGNGKLRVTNVTFGFAGIFPAWWKQGDAQPFWFCHFLSCLPRIKALERTLTHGPVLCVTVKATKAHENVQNHKKDKHPGLPPPQNGLFFKLVSDFLYSLNYLCDKFSNLLLMPYNHSSPSIRFPGAQRGTLSPWRCLEEKADEIVQSWQGDYGPSLAAKWKHYLPRPSLCIHFLPQTFHFSANGFCTVRSTLINNAHFSGIVKMFVKGY